MILADAATIVITGHIERPMERMLTMPVLADHNHKGRSGPYQACNRDAIVTGGRGARVGGAHGFDDHHGAESRPCGQCRKSGAGRHGPDPAPHQTALLVIEGSREMLAAASGSLRFDGCMAVLCDRFVGLCVSTFQG